MESSKDEHIIKIEETMGLQFPEDQIDIIKHAGKPANVISCAGSGKTTLMVANLVYNQLNKENNLNMDKAIVISFNRTAVEEIEQRYKEIANKLVLSTKVTFKTFHALYYTIIKKYYSLKGNESFRVMSEEDASRLFNRAFYSKAKDKSEESKDNIKSLRSFTVNNLIKTRSELVNNPRFINAGVGDDYFEVVSEYRRLKNEENKLDFEDLQLHAYKIICAEKEIEEFVKNKWDVWFIDEYQDISKIQMEILKKSVRDFSNIVTIGDEDQCIFEFRGSKVDYIVDFPVYFQNSKRYHMSINYRCPEVILQMAEKTIVNNKKRIQKKMKAYNTGGTVEYIGSKTFRESSDIVVDRIKELYNTDENLSEIAVLFRHNKQQIFIIDMLIELGIPVKVTKRSNLLYDHAIVRDIINIVELAMDETDSFAFSKVFGKITPYFPKKKINNITKKMISTGQSWRYFVENENNENISNTSYELEFIKNIVEEKGKMIEVINRIYPIYKRYLDFMAGNSESGDREIQDIVEYLRQLCRDKTYKQFIFHMERAKSLVDMYSKDKEAVTITTMHTVKGLEFNHVFLLGCDQDTIPGQFRIDQIIKLLGTAAAEDYIEQERRLFYVSCTRAKKKLVITYSDNNPSIFILEQLEETEFVEEEKICEPYILFREQDCG